MFMFYNLLSENYFYILELTPLLMSTTYLNAGP